MKLHIISLCLDAMPFLPMQLAIFNQLKSDWRWHVVHGAAANTGSTSWCQPQEPRLSTDGSTEFINSLRSHPRVRTYQKQWWGGGKDEMTLAPLNNITEDCVLMQIDTDEIWRPDQLDLIAKTVKDGVGAHFFCRYFLGPNIIATGEDCYGNKKGEWARAWSFSPGMKFQKHEPPVMIGQVGTLSREFMRDLGLVFDHWAYVFPKQVIYKQAFYGYQGAYEHWQRLQNNTKWPVPKLKKYLPWVDDRAGADLLWK